MIHKDKLQMFFDTAWERHRIYVLKELGCPKPWTSNKILRDNFFCCTFRALDKTTKWIVKNVIEPNEDDSELWMAILMCRYISRIDTLERLHNGGCLVGDRRQAYKQLRQWQSEGVKLFTNAFIVNSRARGVWLDKVSYMFRNNMEVFKKFDQFPDQRIQEIDTMEKLFWSFCGLPGIGGFMAFQYAVDFTYSKRYLSDPADALTWTHLGIGAIRGMNRLLGKLPKKHKIENPIELCQEILLAWSQEVMKNYKDEVYKTYELAYEHDENILVATLVKMYEPFYHLDMSNVEHWLCEFDKYMRGGSKKRSYRGGS